MIETLPALTPSPERGARGVGRCHAKLAQQRRKIARSDARAARIERAIGATFCVIYAAAMIVNAIRIMAHA